MKTHAHSPEPDPDGIQFDLSRDQIPPPAGLFAQGRAAMAVAGEFLRYRAIGRGRVVAAIGPTGCGKSHVLKHVAHEHGLSLVPIDLSQIQSRSQLSAEVAGRLADRGFPPQAVVLATGLRYASPEAIDAFVRLGSDRDATFSDPRRASQPLASADYLWVAEITSHVMAVDESEGRRLLGAYLPSYAQEAVGRYIVFDLLGNGDLFAILAVGGFAPFVEAVENLKTQGIECELSEMALWELVHRSREEFGGMGARSLAQAVMAWEASCWDVMANVEGSR